jgi:hypothetical protein
MTSDEIIWQLGPHTLVGKEKALEPHVLDAALHASWEPRNIVVRGDTVECVLLEQSDVTKAFGMARAVHYARYVFKDGLMYRQEPWKKRPDMSKFTAKLDEFRQWISEAHPNELARLDSLGAISHFSREVGELRSRLLREWAATRRP